MKDLPEKQNKKKVGPKKGFYRTAVLLCLVLFVGIAVIAGMARHSGKADSMQTITKISKTEIQTDNAVAGSKNKNTASPKQISDNSLSGTSETESQPSMEDQAEKILDKLSLYQKICQMFIVTPEALTGKTDFVTSADKAVLDGLNSYPVGGMICFAGNIKDPDQLKEMMTGIQSAASKQEGMPLLTGVDEEGGSVARIAGNDKFQVTKFPDMKEIASVKQAYHVGDTIGSYLKEYGFNLDFAPDADVLTNPQNKVIGARSFGKDPADVTAKALAVYQGLSSHHILAVFKHFPGHGATKGDTHEGFAFTDRTYEEMEKEELVPFQAAVENKVPLILVAHISVPKITGDNTPASLSGKVVTDILRNKMQYQGLIVTDALNMGAIEKIYTSSQAAVMAIQAGDDLLLMPKDFPAAIQAVQSAVSKGQITEERINESVKRIILAKLSLQKEG